MSSDAHSFTAADSPSAAAPLPKTDAATRPAISKKKALHRPLVILLLVGIVAVLSFFGLRLLTRSWAYESTDDAFTEGHIVPIAPRVAGQILAVHVKENQQVKKGDLLVEIDSRDYELSKSQKSAGVTSATSSRATAKAGLGLVEAKRKTAMASRDQARAEAESAEASAKRGAADFERAQELRQRKVIAPQEFDSARAAAESTAQNFQAAKQKLVGAESGVVEAEAQVEAAHTYIESANVKVEQAELDQRQAELDLSRTKIVAPDDGTIARKSAEPGAYVQVGQTLLALVPKRVWVVANFKETQLAHMRAGQPAEVKISAFPGRTFRAHVESFQPGSGARFSLFPPENATGNFVKVVQRVPVKLEFDEALDGVGVMGPGLSVDPEVRIRSDLPDVVLLVAAGVIATGLAILLFRRAHRAA